MRNIVSIDINHISQIHNIMQKPQVDKILSSKWLQVPQNLNLNIPFIRGTPIRPVSNDTIQYQIMIDTRTIQLQIKNSASYLYSGDKFYDDMCDMDILNQPEILNNLVERYKNNQIFTFIGSTIIAINPYRLLPELFGNEIMVRIRDRIINGKISVEKPHIYLIAGNAYISMIDQKKKQAIVISGESGAGKTETTKYCLQILTSLSHKQYLSSIQSKILACNPLLQAFGNSKTVRNNNSSRFGKYMQIYFFGDNTIVGASIKSYLLEKSRVVATAQNERNFHVFYAVIAAGRFVLEEAGYYRYLARSKCYTAAGIDDRKYFDEIQSSMKSIGFSVSQENKIWSLLMVILELGNIQFDDTAHRQHESYPCNIKDKKEVDKVAQSLGLNVKDLQKLFLFEKKKFLKQITLSPYNKTKCIANINTLSKAIYNAIFEFILYKSQNSLKPQKSTQNYISINILDIFGFENFEQNSFEQFCINFTNEKLLKLYNRYIFEREMEILEEDGLVEQASGIKAPTNDLVIEMISGKLSMFSIINDITTTQQLKENDIIQGFESKLNKYSTVKFDKFQRNDFTIVHSQCNVRYCIEGFKQKNQDKVLPQIAEIVNNLFQQESREQSGKTLLTKFSSQIDDLLTELQSSNVHFIRCIKPNEKKVAGLAEQKYIMNQVRYLGIFETIQIRKKTFPARWLYSEFLDRFQLLFDKMEGSAKERTEDIMQKMCGNRKQQYLLGDKRIYMNAELQNRISARFHELMKKKYENMQKIWKFYRACKLKRGIIKNLKKVVHRINILKKIFQRQGIKLIRLKQNSYMKIKQRYLLRKRQEEKAKQQEKIKQLKKSKQLYDTMKKQNRKKCCERILTVKFLLVVKQAFQGIKIEGRNNEKKKNEKQLNMNKKLVEGSSTIYQSVGTANGQGKKRNNIEDLQLQTKFNKTLIIDKKFVVPDQRDTLFVGYITVPPFDQSNCPYYQKLTDILSQKSQPQYTTNMGQQSSDSFSPPSADGIQVFQPQQANTQITKGLSAFNQKQFYKRVLRKRTNFLGMKKDQDDILVCKDKPLSISLTILNEDDDKIAIKIFKHLLKILDQANVENVFTLIELFIEQCQNTSPEVKNQVLLQFMKQSNSQNQLSSIRIIQAMTVFLHVYNPEKQFLFAGLNFFLKKLSKSKSKYSQKQSQYFQYIINKLIRKLQNAYCMNYVPIKYQLMALMCKRKILTPVYLSIGACVMISVESYETFEGIKGRVMVELGINAKRLNPELFGFFEVISMDGSELEENPIVENGCVWDTITYWEKAKQRYKENNLTPPLFHLMLKIRYMYQCHKNDYQTISLMFAQAQFQYLIGRVILPDLDDMSVLACIVKKLKDEKQQSKQSVSSVQDIAGCYPNWVHKANSDEQLKISMMKNQYLIDQKKMKMMDLKFLFVEISSKCRTCLSFIVPAQNDMKICFRPNLMTIVNKKTKANYQIALKSITKFQSKEQIFYFGTKNSSDTKQIPTEYASLCSNYLERLQVLVDNSKKNNLILAHS